jgi:hypothetical protein
MKPIVIYFLLTSFAFGQSVPDAPSITKKQLGDKAEAEYVAPAATCGRFHWSCWDYYPTMTNMEALRSKSYLIPLGIFTAASWADRIYSVQIEHNTSCVEGNSFLPSKPGYGDMALNWAYTEIPTIFSDLPEMPKEKVWMRFVRWQP